MGPGWDPHLEEKAWLEGGWKPELMVWGADGAIGQYALGELVVGRGLATLLVITLSPALWCPEEDEDEEDDEGAGGCSIST